MGTRNVLESLKDQMAESMGVRTTDKRPTLSPVANAKDVGRRALRTFGTLTVDSIMADPSQPRSYFDEEELQRLGSSLKEKGQMHPIHVRWAEEHQKWLIISGERRFRASKLAGLDTVQCKFVEGTQSDAEILEQQLIENLIREDLTPLEEAKGFDQLRKLTGWTNKQVAESLRVPESKLTRLIALLKLPLAIQQEVESGKLAARAAYEISKLGSEEKMLAALQQSKLADVQMTVAQAKREVLKSSGKATKPKPRGKKQQFVAENGWKITVTKQRAGTYLEVEEALQEALDEVRLRIENSVELS